MKMSPSEARYALATNMESSGIPLADRLRLYTRMIELGWSPKELREHGAMAIARAAEIKTRKEALKL